MPTCNEWPIRVFFYEKFPRHGARNKVSRKVLVQEVHDKVAEDPKAGLTDNEFQFENFN